VNQEALRTLGLNVNAGPDEVRQAYRRMARLTHPDVHPDAPGAADRFRAVRSAREAL
jgi:molecular chaperone DnaJ